MEKREFIRTACLACIGGTLTSLLLSSCKSVHYVTGTLENNQLVLKKADFVQTAKDKTTYRQWVLVKSEKLSFPVGVFRFSEQEFAASYLECTHQGCEVAPQGSYLQCPCHGSEYDNRGKVQQGPAEENLKTFQIKTDDANIYILL
jgi:Rieske Fe-S protein